MGEAPISGGRIIMTALEKTLLFNLIDKYTGREIDDGYIVMDLEKLVIEYAESRDIELDYVEIY